MHQDHSELDESKLIAHDIASARKPQQIVIKNTSDFTTLGSITWIKPDHYWRATFPIEWTISLNAFKHLLKTDNYEWMRTIRNGYHWIPMFVNKNHADRSFELFKQAILAIQYYVTEFHELACRGKHEKFLPEEDDDKLFTTSTGFRVHEIDCSLIQLVQLMLKLMFRAYSCSFEGNWLNNYVVSTYFQLHLWLLYMQQRFPEVEEYINTRIGNFINDATKRTFAHEPSMSIMLPLISVSSKYSWNDAKAAVLEEAFARIAKCTAEVCHLYHFEMQPVNRRDLLFAAGINTLKAIMFQVSFEEILAKPPLLSSDELRMAQPTGMMLMRFCSCIEHIKKVQNLSQFMAAIHMTDTYPTTASIDQLIADTTVLAANRGYYQPMRSSSNSTFGLCVEIRVGKRGENLPYIERKTQGGPYFYNPNKNFKYATKLSWSFDEDLS